MIFIVIFLILVVMKILKTLNVLERFLREMAVDLIRGVWRWKNRLFNVSCE